jgi:hypothetical protein
MRRGTVLLGRIGLLPELSPTPVSLCPDAVGDVVGLIV